MEIDINMESVRRSNTIDKIGYNSLKKIMEVHFKSGGKYRYYDVPEHLFKAVFNSKSPGKSFRERIKDKFMCIKVDK